MNTMKALPYLCVLTFACLTGLNLGYIVDDPIVSFGGFFHVVRWLKEMDHGFFSTYLMAGWDVSDPSHTSLPLSHVYHVRFAWGLVYPLLSTLYAGVAEGFRHLLDAQTNYLEILVRAGNLALIVHWLIVVAVLGWAFSRIVDLRLRARLAVAMIVATVFDYFVSNNLACFNGHRLFVHFHDGFLYAMTLNVPRSAVAIVLGLYVAARLLQAEGGRCWLIPVAFAFHIGVATIVCATLCVAEALMCLVRRERTRDLLVLGICALGGFVASATFGSTGHPTSTTGVLPAGAVFKVVIGHAVTHPVVKDLIPIGIGALGLVGGIWGARREHWVEAARACMVIAAMSGVFLVQFATGHAIVAKLLFWHDNPSVHSLLYIFGYASSPVILGLSLWLFVRGGEWVAGRATGHVSEFGATALVASVALSSAFLIGMTTSRRTQSAIHLAPSQVLFAEVFRQVWEPRRWQAAYAVFVPEGPSFPYLAFSDRRFWVGKGWIFNAIVYLRNLHQSVVLGPVVGAPEIVPWRPQTS